LAVMGHRLQFQDEPQHGVTSGGPGAYAVKEKP